MTVHPCNFVTSGPLAPNCKRMHGQVEAVMDKFQPDENEDDPDPFFAKYEACVLGGRHVVGHVGCMSVFALNHT